MPYIKKELRLSVSQGGVAFDAGQLNYLFTDGSLAYLLVKGESYQTYNDIIGALECCKLGNVPAQDSAIRRQENQRKWGCLLMWKVRCLFALWLTGWELRIACLADKVASDPDWEKWEQTHPYKQR